MHSDSQSAIARLQHIGPGPDQQVALNVNHTIHQACQQFRWATLTRVKGHAGTPGNGRTDILVGEAASSAAGHPRASLSYLKLKVSEGYNAAKEAWNVDPGHWGTLEIPIPAPKKSCADRDRNSIARAAA